jgi:hypothetical protein
MNSKYILRIGIILMMLISVASAQTVDPKYFRCLAWSQDIPGLFFTQSELPEPPTAENPDPAPNPDYKEEQLRIPGAIRSQLYSYLPDKPLKIIRHVGNKIILISNLDMQQAPGLALLFFIPGKSTMDIRVIDDGLDKFPGGGVELFNYSHIIPTFAIETTAGKKSIQIDPGSSKIIALNFDPNTTARVSVWVPGRSSPTFSTAWDMFSSIRYTAFVIDDPNDRSNVRYTRVPDNISNLKMDLEREKAAH